MANRKYFGYRSFNPEPDAHRRFAARGVDTICFFVSNTTNSLGEPYCKYPPCWVFDNYSPQGKCDFEPADEQMSDLLRDCPDAKFICMVDLNTPLWLGRTILRYDTFNQLGCICSDPQWRDVTSRYMRNFLEHMERKYADKIVAYVLACGNTTEWYDYSELLESPSRSIAWNEDRKAKGLPPKDAPGAMARSQVSFDGLLRDPQANGEALDYIRFCAGQIPDTIKFFLKEARKTIRSGIELGIYYGYPLCLEWHRVIWGNNDCRELLRCDDLDFIISPLGGFSEIGKGGGDLGPTDSVMLHGKGYLRECDQRTHTYNKKISKHACYPYGTWYSEAETLAGIKRELAYSLIKQTSLWWFDMWGGFYDPPVVMDLIGKAKDIYWQNIQKPVAKVAEIALVVDPDSIHYFNQEDARVRWFYIEMKKALDLIGAPYECYEFDDIPQIANRERIKLWLLPALFEVTPEKMEILDRHVRLKSQSSLYMYAPGISDGKSLDVSRVKRLCGTEYGTPGFNVVDMDGHLSAYLATGGELTTQRLKELATRTGVHLYCEEDVPVYANDSILAVHTASGGQKKIRLPKESAEIRELFSGEIVARGCKEFVYEFKTPDTAIFNW